MPRTIPTRQPLVALDGVLLPRAQLRAQRQALQQQAWERARQLLRQAQRRAAAIRQQAAALGYAQGLLSALQAAATQLDDAQRLQRQLRAGLAEQAHAMLAATFEHPDALLLALDDWLERSAQPPPTLQLRLPSTWQQQLPQLRQLLEQRWNGALQIVCSEQPRLLLRCGALSAEFAPPEYLEQAATALLQRGIGTDADVDASCRRLAAAGLDALCRQLRQRIAELDSAVAAAQPQDGAS